MLESDTRRSTRFQDPEGRVLYFNIIGPSMRPLLKSGDLLTAEPYRGTRIRVGDVVVFSPPHETRLVTHRLVSIREGRYFAQGDNNSRIDPWPLCAQDILGKVTHVQSGTRPQRLASGMIGRVLGSVVRGFNASRRQVFYLIRPWYRWAAKLGIFRWIVRPGVDVKIIRVTRHEGSELHLILGRRIIGKLAPGQNRWWIRPPFRLMIDETRLPRSGEGI